MIAIIGNSDRKEIRVLRGSLLILGYPAAAVTMSDRETLSSSLAVVSFDRSVPPFVDSERTAFADPAALASDEPGVASCETLRIKDRAEEVVEIKNGVRFDNFASKCYAERNDVSVFLGERIPLTERERLVVRLLSVYPGRYLAARTIAAFCFSDPVSDGAARSTVYEINKKAKNLTGFPLIKTKPKEGYSFGG